MKGGREGMQYPLFLLDSGPFLASITAGIRVEKIWNISYLDRFGGPAPEPENRAVIRSRRLVRKADFPYF